MTFFSVVKPLSNLDILEMCKILKINNFKGVYMRNELKGKGNPNESLIVNMDDSTSNGTHWTSLFINENDSYYFDSFGLPPPKEVISYCPDNTRYYNTFKIQKPEEVICGHYCIYIIYMLSNNYKFYDILKELV